MIPPNVERWRSLVSQIVQQPLLINEVLAVIWNESSGNPEAVNVHDPSYGLMQLTMPIARAYGGTEDTTEMDLLDPEINLVIGCKFLRYLKCQYYATHQNYWIAAYNEGEGHMLSGVQDDPYVNAFHSHLNELNASDNTSVYAKFSQQVEKKG